MESYIIDGFIVFTPGERVIFSLKNNKKSTINSAGARCFKLLLEQQGEIVSQSELMIAGWGDDALSKLSIPAYYQCFVNLRKSFRDIGYKKDLFTTFRGKGIMVNTYVLVKKEILDCIIDNQQESVENCVSHQPDKEDVLTEPEETELCNKRNSPIKIKAIACILLFLIIGVLVAIHLPNEGRSVSLSGYTRTVDSPSCFYFNNKNKNNAFITEYLINNKYNCTKDKNYFISYFSAAPRLSIFICGKSKPFNCDSVTYILDGEGSENE
ncbi:TPA: hypothetical protein LVM22_001080 [Klebsiella oxytoca]|nr:hypothetical protein [Klebsiella oxytoca]